MNKSEIGVACSTYRWEERRGAYRVWYGNLRLWDYLKNQDTF